MSETKIETSGAKMMFLRCNKKKAAFDFRIVMVREREENSHCDIYRAHSGCPKSYT
jgi:hypothetical protein